MNFNHEVIHMCWSQDLNKTEEVLAFAFGKHIVTAKHAGLALTRDGFKAMVLDIKKNIAGDVHRSLLHFFWQAVFMLYV